MPNFDNYGCQKEIYHKSKLLQTTKTTKIMKKINLQLKQFLIIKDYLNFETVLKYLCLILTKKKKNDTNNCHYKVKQPQKKLKIPQKLLQKIFTIKSICNNKSNFGTASKD